MRPYFKIHLNAEIKVVHGRANDITLATIMLPVQIDTLQTKLISPLFTNIIYTINEIKSIDFSVPNEIGNNIVICLNGELIHVTSKGETIITKNYKQLENFTDFDIRQRSIQLTKKCLTYLPFTIFEKAGGAFQQLDFNSFSTSPKTSPLRK